MASRYKAASWRFVAAFWGAVVLVVLKAAHWPNAWSLTHYLFSYEKGFTKRALFGELIRQTLGERRFEEHYLGAVAIGVLGVLACVLLGAAWRRRDQMMVLFLVSPGASYVVYTVGYLDHVLYAIVLAGVVAISKRRDLAPWIAMAVGVMAILVHEGALLSALPLLGVALAVHTRRLAPAGLAIAGCAALACAASLSFALFPVDQAALKTGLAMKARAVCWGIGR